MSIKFTESIFEEAPLAGLAELGRTLVVLRDALLLKLLSGEVCLKDMIKYMENVPNAFAT